MTRPLIPAKLFQPSPLALTMGDPAGIGPEITCKAWHEMRYVNGASFFVIGDPALYGNCKIIQEPKQASEVFATALPVLPITVPDVEVGIPNKNAASAITNSIQLAVKFALSGQASAVVTNPIAKDVLYSAGFAFPGHTEYLSSLTQETPAPYTRGPVMMLSAKGLRVALTSIHIPLAEVPKAITKTTIKNAAQVLHGALKVDLGISAPRIALCGLNPHAGENGALGQEEITIINPAAKELRKQGIKITNAQSADTLFHTEAREGYDAVLAMYHDQGLIPVKTLDFHGGVNTTLGLPMIRTSPDHGTAFAIAGQGIARADSLIAAMHHARKMAHHRHNHG